LVNPGAEEYLKELKGDARGMPFFAVTDPTGKKIMDASSDKSPNIAYPSDAESIAHFMKVLKATASRMSDADRTTIEAWLTARIRKS
jgi:hypothetical protein